MLWIKSLLEFIRSVQWSPNGNYFGTASMDSTAKVFDIGTEKAVLTINLEADSPRQFFGGESDASSCCFIESL